MGIPISLVPMYMSGQMTERAAKSTRFPIMCLRNSPSFFSSICGERGAHQRLGGSLGSRGRYRALLPYLSDTLVLLRHQFVHVLVKHDVDVALQ